MGPLNASAQRGVQAGASELNNQLYIRTKRAGQSHALWITCLSSCGTRKGATTFPMPNLELGSGYGLGTHISEEKRDPARLAYCMSGEYGTLEKIDFFSARRRTLSTSKSFITYSLLCPF